MNQYPAWKYLLIAVLMIVGVLYALPNLYEADPAVQVSAGRGVEMNDTVQSQIEARLSEKNIPLRSIKIDAKQLLARFNNTEDQLAAADLIKDTLGMDYAVALNLAPSTPAWLRSINAEPMYLGLDLRGGVHFLMEVDMDAALQKALERYASDLRTVLRKEKVRYLSIRPKSDKLLVKFRNAADREKGSELIHDEYADLELKEIDAGKAYCSFNFFHLIRSEGKGNLSISILINPSIIRVWVNMSLEVKSLFSFLSIQSFTDFNSVLNICNSDNRSISIFH